MLLACGLPFHFGEIALMGGGILMGAAIVGRLCWCYIKARFVKTRLDKGSCACDCCHHVQPDDDCEDVFMQDDATYEKWKDQNESKT